LVFLILVGSHIEKKKIDTFSVYYDVEKSCVVQEQRKGLRRGEQLGELEQFVPGREEQHPSDTLPLFFFLFSFCILGGFDAGL
jgi:hypothetical protein